MLSIKQMESEYQQMRQYKRQIVKSTKPSMEHIVHRLKVCSRKMVNASVTATSKLPPIASRGAKRRPPPRQPNSANHSASVQVGSVGSAAR